MYTGLAGWALHEFLLLAEFAPPPISYAYFEACVVLVEV